MNRRLKDILAPICIDYFHRFYYSSNSTWERNTYLGYRIQQCPLDMYTYQEIIYKTKPNIIIQTGVAAGGSLLYFATLLDAIKASPECLVIGVDISVSETARTLDHPRIRLIEGSSIDENLLRQIQDAANGNRGMVVLDSDHKKEHVCQELRRYSRFVALGQYMVIEDTNVNGHPVYRSFGPGPYEAVQGFLDECNDFVRDDAVWRRNLFSFHQYGWLRRSRE